MAVPQNLMTSTPPALKDIPKPEVEGQETSSENTKIVSADMKSYEASQPNPRGSTQTQPELALENQNPAKAPQAGDLDDLTFEKVDEKGPGGAHHAYLISHPSISIPFGMIKFQKGGVVEAGGVNGISHEILIDILVDRLQDFQAGDFSCRENAIALTKLQEARMWLAKRTADRKARGVEGKSVV